MLSEITQRYAAPKISFAEELILLLQTMYTPQFNKNFADKPMHLVEQIITATLNGVTQEEFNKGKARLLSGQSKFMPTVQEFKSWCISGNWWTASEAWYHACKRSEDTETDPEKRHKITVITHECWAEVSHLVNDGKMTQAQRQFTDLYEDRVTRAQIKGLKQQIYVPPKALPLQIKERDWKQLSPRGQTPEHLNRVKELTQKYIAQGMPLASAGILAAKELKDLL